MVSSRGFLGYLCLHKHKRKWRVSDGEVGGGDMEGSQYSTLLRNPVP